MTELGELGAWALVVLVLLGAILLGVLFTFIPVRLWIEAWFSGVRIGLTTLIGMRLRKVSPPGGGAAAHRRNQGGAAALGE